MRRERGVSRHGKSLLFDTSDWGAATYEYPRALQVKTFFWNGAQRLMYDRGNELSIVDITDPATVVLQALPEQASRPVELDPHGEERSAAPRVAGRCISPVPIG